MLHYSCFSGDQYGPYVLTEEAEKIHNQRWLYARLVNSVRDYVEVEGEL
jgi:hypothetical protein